MTVTVRGKASNRTARRMILSSPMTRVGGNDSASAYNLAMISGPMPQASPIVIAMGKSFRLDIGFYFHQCVSHGSRAAKAASLCHQRERLCTEDSHGGDTRFHLAQDFESVYSQRIT